MYQQAKSKKGFFGVILIAALVFLVAYPGGNVQAKDAKDYYGVYAGGHAAGGMGGKVAYTYSVELKADGSYELKSYFVMGDDLYEFIETGAYVLDMAAGTFVITPEGKDAVNGSLNADGTITVGVKPSQMASQRTEAVLTRSTSAVAGVYKAALKGAAVINATLYLDHQGGYAYLAVPEGDGEAVHENGSYSVNGGDITFKIADSDTTFAGKTEAGQVSASFVVSAKMGMRMEIKVEK